MALKLLFTLICDDIRIENTSKLVLVGVYNRTINFPPLLNQNQSQPSTPPRYMMPKLCLFRRWEMDSPDCTVKTEVVDPEGKTIMSFDTRITRPQGSGFGQEIIQLVAPIFSVGFHKIRTKYEDRAPVESEELFEVRVDASIIAANQATTSVAPTQV